jgi:hypothetical protein
VKLRCVFTGHRWRVVDDAMLECERCGARQPASSSSTFRERVTAEGNLQRRGGLGGPR